MDQIPQDDTTRKKILDIIDQQFDLEIFLKQRELATIRQEIQKSETTLRDLEAAINNEANLAAIAEGPHYTRRAAALTAASALYNSHNSSTSQDRGPGLYGVRSDGVFVRLSCPACHRDDFANQQGFLNHCRLRHGLEFGPYEQIMLRCGTPVDESEVPPDHPARLRQVTKPVPLPRKKIRPSIKVFEEDVDLEGDQQKHTRQDTAAKSVPSSTQSTSAARPKTPPPPQSLQPPPPPPTTTTTITTTTTTTEPPRVIPTTADTAAGPSQVDRGSRFYIQRKVIVGNVSKFIPPEKRDAVLKNYSHKWMAYVVDPPQVDEAKNFVTCVRFHLHPSYKPYDVVDVTEPPYRVTRLGWGEFPIRVQLFLVDKRRNKSVDVFTQIKLDQLCTGNQVLGQEREIDIELDRNTDFADKAPPPEYIAPTPPAQPSQPVISSSSITGSLEPEDALHRLLVEAVARLPLVQPYSSPMLPYSCATSPKAYFQWSIGRRKAVEWHRAHLVRQRVQQLGRMNGNEAVRTVTAALSTKDVVLWCRNHDYTPKKADQTWTHMQLPDYCKYCGERHYEDCARMAKRTVSSLTSSSDLLRLLPQGWDEDREADDMELDVGTVSQRPPNSTDKMATLSELARLCSEQANDIVNERYVDWIWSTLEPLSLDGVVANSMAVSREGQLRPRTDDSVNMEQAMEQRLVVGNLLAQATRAFLRRLLKASLRQIREGQPSGSMLVPLHVHAAAQSHPEFDFLTQQYMGPSNEPDQP